MSESLYPTVRNASAVSAKSCSLMVWSSVVTVRKSVGELSSDHAGAQPDDAP
jgi:hypothetical protein